MQIILLEQVRKLGNIGEIVNVKNGYARNYLIPNSKALRATKANIDLFEMKKSEIKKQNDIRIKEAQDIAKNIEGLVVSIISQAGEDGRLYGSVSITDIAKAINESAKTEIPRKQVMLHDPIKYIGIYNIEIELHAEISAHVNVNIARTEDEAKIAIKRFEKGEDVNEAPAEVITEEVEEAPEAANDSQEKVQAEEEKSDN